MAFIPQPQPWNDASVHEFGRDFLAFSVQHGIHCVPIDDVSGCQVQSGCVMAGIAIMLPYRDTDCNGVSRQTLLESSNNSRGNICQIDACYASTRPATQRLMRSTRLQFYRQKKLTFAQEELNRQADFYDIVSRLFERRLFLPADLTPEFILDCGSGSGVEWAEEVMEKSELGSRSSSSGDDDFACQVVAVDIFHTEGSSPGVLKKRWNLNEAFRYDQAELARDRYDLVNSRFLAGGINKDRWSSYIQDLHDRTRRGGWLQMIEAQLNIQSDSGRPVEHLSRWWSIYSHSLEERNKDPRAMVHLRRHMSNAGFVDIVGEPKQLPVGEWHPDPHLREIGRDMKSIALETLKSLGVWHCRKAGITDGEFDELIAGCARELSDTSLRLYIQLYAVWGQRAENEQKRANARGAAYIPDPSKPPLPLANWG